ncbi:hypothetical protein [Cohnella fermenti]|uniref:DUF429 domain-containing protein n=1 Tax=Cohnella fermenti TaxID=2565925 RepID=A0A4S4C3E0_9BACL|nr:hypothetical protein [Cohnella fermenti]THF82256.1 hypothetical protein E6C55_07710 [Cohnella fermenti]
MERAASFERYIGIDYSGRGEPHERTAGIQAVEADAEGNVMRISPPAGRGKTYNWSRRELYEYVRGRLAAADGPLAIGIDHNLSFPGSYFERHGLRDWDEFLRHFCELWETKEHSVRACRERVPPYRNAHELRLTETFTSSAKSAWNFDQMTGAVSYSTHAGLPWIRELRAEFRDTLHVWPYDGWLPAPGRHLLAEAYPALLYQRYKQYDRSFPREWPRDAQDALVIARWLRDRDRNGTLERYLRADTLAAEEKELAQTREGWILGVC